MDIEIIKNKVQNYGLCSIEEIEEILSFIVDRKKKELGIEFEFETVYDDGGRVKTERTEEGHQQVEIGELELATIKGDRELGLEVDTVEERKEFIELILQTFHELRHVKQNDNITDHPVLNDETLKMTRESIINDSFWGFRNNNYEQSMMEIDAMKTSLEEAVNFFQEMGSDISPDEVLAVMKEKELQFLDYDVQNFGESYQTATAYFNQIYGNVTEIKGLDGIIERLPEDKKTIFNSQCKGLMADYDSEIDIEKKLDLLKDISLVMTPELSEQYPLISAQNEKVETKSETKIGIFDRIKSILSKLKNPFSKDVLTLEEGKVDAQSSEAIRTDKKLSLTEQIRGYSPNEYEKAQKEASDKYESQKNDKGAKEYRTQGFDRV